MEGRGGGLGLEKSGGDEEQGRGERRFRVHKDNGEGSQLCYLYYFKGYFYKKKIITLLIK